DIGAYGQYWKSGKSTSGLGKPKILEMAETNASNLISSKEGVWFVDDVLNKAQPGIGHVNYNDLPDNYKDYVKKKATDYLYS
ncbi:hypothetical protein, partial [Listeria monocytogenes]|uniref:hypothetical protein n=1 Tax=Listeria monocytogenes TaxID=1639 RepID=UPI002FDC0BF7